MNTLEQQFNQNLEAYKKLGLDMPTDLQANTEALQELTEVLRKVFKV